MRCALWRGLHATRCSFVMMSWLLDVTLSKSCRNHNMELEGVTKILARCNENESGGPS